MTPRQGIPPPPPRAPGGETRLAAAALLRGEALAEPHLVVAEGPDAGRRHPLRDSTTVGRGVAADLRLSDPAISRLHARIERVGQRWLAEDLGSRNGLRLNGRRCRRPRPLAPGDELELGATRLRVQPGLLDAPCAGGEASGRRVASREVPRPTAGSAAAGTRGPPRVEGPGAASLALAAALAAAAAALLLVP